MASSAAPAAAARAPFAALPVLRLPPADGARGSEPGAAQDAAFALRLREVCHTVGFFYIADHGVEAGPGVLAAAKEFFDLDLADKMGIDYRQ